jgi:hypothetical protein
MCLSSTENGDRASKFVQWVVEAGRELQATPTVFHSSVICHTTGPQPLPK